MHVHALSQISSYATGLILLLYEHAINFNLALKPMTSRSHIYHTSWLGIFSHKSVGRIYYRTLTYLMMIQSLVRLFRSI